MKSVNDLMEYLYNTRYRFDEKLLEKELIEFKNNARKEGMTEAVDIVEKYNNDFQRLRDVVPLIKEAIIITRDSNI